LGRGRGLGLEARAIIWKVWVISLVILVVDLMLGLAMCAVLLTPVVLVRVVVTMNPRNRLLVRSYVKG
jgi:hypothetical protein